MSQSLDLCPESYGKEHFLRFFGFDYRLEIFSDLKYLFEKEIAHLATDSYVA